MDKLPDVGAWGDVFVRAAGEVANRFAEFAPNLLGALLILVVGWGVSRLVEVAARRGLHTFGLDRAAVRLRASEVLDRAGIRLAPSELVARLLFWLLLLTFLLSSVDTLGLAGVSATMDRLIAFIPNLIGAALIALVGLLLARFVGTVSSSAAAASGFPGARRLGFVAQVTVAALVIVAAVEQLGVAASILIAPLTALVAAVGLSAGLAFALGARPIVTHILAGHFLRQSLPRDAFIEIQGDRGVVERIGATDTLLRNGQRAWSVPNARLLEDVVVR